MSDKIREKTVTPWQIPASPNKEMASFNKAMAAVRGRHELLHSLHQHLPVLLACEQVAISLTDPDTHQQTAFFECERYGSRLEKLLYDQEQSDVFEKEIVQPALLAAGPLVFTPQRDQSGVQAPTHHFLGDAMQTLLVLQLRPGHQPIGCLYVAWRTHYSFSEDDLLYLESIAGQLSVAIAGLLTREASLKKERAAANLLALSNAIAVIRTRNDLRKVIDERLRKVVPFHGFALHTVNADGKTQSPFLYQNTEEPAPADTVYPLDDALTKALMAADHPIVFDVQQYLHQPPAPAWIGHWHTHGIRQIIGLAISNGQKCTGFFYLLAQKRSAIAAEDLELLKNLGLQLSVAVHNIQANEQLEKQLHEINAYKQRLENEQLYLKEHLDITYQQEEMAGNSPGLKKVFNLIGHVARTSSTVLVLGETGTGKELVARAIHQGSARKDQLMIKVNCAALPANLIESELFGHEKGAFTGATDRRIGKFELAHNSTLFLDEIGELPLDLQVKLLRALQEKEIERVGGKGVIKVDVRIIAATNRNLLKEVQAGTFRSDLYYRLNVFPLQLPPLRERGDDIGLLAAHFVQRYAKKAGKDIRGLSPQVLQQLSHYHWPGNIRELEHLMERQVLLTSGQVITDVHLPGLYAKEASSPEGEIVIKSLFDNERDHIMAALKHCNGKIAGIGGAAQLLGIPATTLNSKLKKFNIKRQHIIL